MADFLLFDDGSNNSNSSEVTCYYREDNSKVLCDGTLYDSEDDEYYQPGETLFYVYLGAYIAATLFAGEFDLVWYVIPGNLFVIWCYHSTLTRYIYSSIDFVLLLVSMHPF